MFKWMRYIEFIYVWACCMELLNMLVLFCVLSTICHYNVDLFILLMFYFHEPLKFK